MLLGRRLSDLSTVIDERVVEMRFDNRQFEEGVRDTLNDLTKLKTALDKSDSYKAFEQLDKATQNIHLDGIAAGVEALQKRFSVFGLIGIKAINGVADTLVNLIKKLYDVTIGQVISGGIKRAMNLENARFQLQALLKDGDKVEAILDNANTAVKGTAYSLDAAAKAASQFAATGLQAGEEMTNALRGIVGVSAMTNSEFESISNIFTTVAGQGRVMGDQLNQLASRGLNAAATLADFANGVIDGSKSASDEVTALIKSFSTGAKMTEGDIRELVTKGRISFRLFSEAMTEAFADSAERANETFTGSLSNIKAALSRIGAGFISPIIAQNSEVVKLFNAIMSKIDEFKKAIVFDEEVGNFRAVSKQFTDMVLNLAKVMINFINNIDTSSVMRDFYYGLETVKNVFKALWVLVKPALMAMSGLISPVGDALYTLLVILEAVTSRMIASEGVSTALGEVFKELVNIIGTLISYALQLIQSVFRPLNRETKTTGNGFVDLLKAVSGALRGFNDWLRSSTLISNSITVLSGAFKIAFEYGKRFGTVVSNVLIKSFTVLYNVLKTLAEVLMSNEGIRAFVYNMVDWFKELANAFSIENIEAKIEHVKNAFTTFISWIQDRLVPDSMKTSAKLTQVISTIKRILTGFINGLVSVVPGLNTLITSLSKGSKSIGELLTEFFSLNNLSSVFDKVYSAGQKLFDWVKKILSPLVQELSLSNIAGIGIGTGFLLSFSKLANAFYILSATMKSALSFQNVLNAIQSTLKAYQQNLKADTLIKIAGAIAILSGALVLLSFADSERLIAASISLGVVGGILFTSLSKLLNAVNRARSIYDVINNFAIQIGKTAKWVAISSVIKSIGTAIVLIVASIAGIVFMYNKYPTEMNIALDVVGKIAGAIVGIVLAMSVVGQVLQSGMKNFSRAALGVLAISASLSLIISSLNKIFKLEIPKDWKSRTKLLVGLIAGLMSLIFILGKASNISGGTSLSALSIVSMAVSLSLIVGAVTKLFKIDFPYDWKTKLNALTMMVVELGGLMVLLGLASHIAGGKIKAFGSILAACIFIGTCVGALMVLTIFPVEKILQGAIAIGGILLALGASLLMASKVTTLETTKSIFGMGMILSAIVAALAVLTIMDATRIIAATASLGIILGAVSACFYVLGKMDTEGVLPVALSMSALIGVIAYALYQLSSQPWDSMLAGGVAMGVVLLAVSGALAIISKSNPNISAMSAFLLALVPMAAIAYALYQLSSQPWDSMLAGAASISMVLVAMAGTLAICSVVGAAAGPAVVGAGLLILFITAITAVVAAIGWLVDHFDAMNIIEKGIEVLEKIGTGLGNAIGGIIDGVLGRLTTSLPKIADDLSDFITRLQPFLEASSKLDADSIRAVKTLADVIIQITKAEMLDGIANFGRQKSNITKFGEQINELAPYLNQFANSVSGIKVESISGASAAAEIISKFVSALPRENGWIDRILGTKKTLAQFGEELIPFGTSLKVFALSVEGITEDSVKGAASAAQIMSELSKNLPKSDGLVQQIFGDKTLSEFGAELVPFGISLKIFASTVSGITEDSVKGAANAGSIMAQLADNLPNSGGVIGWFVGNNDIDDFGGRLEKYGESIVAFVDSVSGLESSNVDGVKVITQIMSDLATSLPNTRSVFSAFTGGQMDFVKFGNQLEKYGQSLAKYSDSVSGINFELIVSATKAIKELIDLLIDIKGVDPNAMANFGIALGAVPGVALSEFVEGFQNADKLILASINKMFDDINKTISSSVGSIDISFNVAINSIVATLLSYLPSAFSRVKRKMIEIGEFVVDGLIAGLNNKMGELKKASDQLGEVVENGVRKSLAINSPSKLMTRLGEYTLSGLIIGLSNTKDVQKASENLGKTIVKTYRDYMGIHSPAKRTEEDGTYTAEGYGLGLEKGFEKVADVAADGVDKIKDVITKKTDGAKDEFYEQIFEVYPDWFKSNAKDITEEVSDEIAKDAEDGIDKVAKATNKKQIKYIEQEKTYWEKLLAIKKAGSDKSKYKDMKMVEFQKSILEESIEIWKEYVNQLTSTRDSVMSSIDLFTEKQSEMASINPFSEISKKDEEVTKDQLTKNLNDQVKQYKDFYGILDKLRKRIGFESDFSDYISTLSVDSYEQLKALNSMTDAELKKYSETYEKHLSYVTEITKKENVKTKEQLVKGLTDQIEQYKEHAEALQTIRARLGEDSELGDYLTNLGVDSVDQLKIINSMTDEELTHYAELYDTKLAYATNIAASQLTDLQKTTEEKLAALYGGMSEYVNLFDFGKVFDNTFESIDNFVTSIMIPFQEAGEGMKAAMEALGPPIVAGLESIDIGGEINGIVDEAIDSVKTEQSENAMDLGSEIGEHISEGISEGLVDTSFGDVASEVMTNIVDNLKEAGEIHSPSELMKREVGIYLGEGIAEGLNSDEVQESISLSVVDLLNLLVDIFKDGQPEIEESAKVLGGLVTSGLMSDKNNLIGEVTSLVDNVISIMQNKWNQTDMFDIGSDIIIFIQNGVLSIRPKFLDTILELCIDTINIMIDNLPEKVFNAIGQNIVIWTDDGVKSVQQLLLSTCEMLCVDIVDSIFKEILSYETFFEIGSQAMQGLSNGILSKLEEVKLTAVQIARDTVKAVEEILEINSPSKVFFEIGEFISMGMAKGMINASDLVFDAATDISNEAVNSVNIVNDAIAMIMDMINGGDFNPELTITPTIDISQIRSGVDEIVGLFNRATVINAQNAVSTASAFNRNSRNYQVDEFASARDSTIRQGVNYNFNQYNYSPKPLSRIDIYRQTNNQFLQFKGATKR